VKSTAEMVSLFRERFVQRADLYPVQLAGGQYTVVRRPLDETVIRRHLQGRITIGLYGAPDSTSKWLCLDIDTHDEVELHRLWRRLDRLQVPHLTEFSGRKGYHLWVFFCSPVPNRLARTLGRALTRKHEVFPKQDHISDGGLGNLVKAPWGVHRVTGARCLFMDRSLGVLPDQLRALAEVELTDPMRVLRRCFPKAAQRLSTSSRVPLAPDGEAIDVAHMVPSVCIIKDCVRLAIGSGTRQGHRNRVGYIIATELRRIGMQPSSARQVLCEVWNPMNRPPLDGDEIERILGSAYEGSQRTFGCRPNGSLRQILECVGRKSCLYSQFLSTTSRSGKLLTARRVNIEDPVQLQAGPSPDAAVPGVEREDASASTDPA